ncbi:MAG: hypothetical protein NTZ71_11665, partial [Planctomycetota bacterium]|nr:hypothetical protein [Planctomycetota bacterium]
MFRAFVALAFLVGLTAVSIVAQEKPKRSPAEEKAIEKLRSMGALVLEVAQNDARLEVSYLQKIDNFGDQHLLPLKDLKTVHALNLRAQPVTDAHVANLKGLTSLARLH